MPIVSPEVNLGGFKTFILCILTKIPRFGGGLNNYQILNQVQDDAKRHFAQVLQSDMCVAAI